MPGSPFEFKKKLKLILQSLTYRSINGLFLILNLVLYIKMAVWIFIDFYGLSVYCSLVLKKEWMKSGKDLPIIHND